MKGVKYLTSPRGGGRTEERWVNHKTASLAEAGSAAGPGQKGVLAESGPAGPLEDGAKC